jgi:hypothetical protein
LRSEDVGARCAVFGGNSLSGAGKHKRIDCTVGTRDHSQLLYGKGKIIDSAPSNTLLGEGSFTEARNDH